MIENYTYDFHEFDSLIKLPNNIKKIDERINSILLQLNDKSVDEIIHITKVSNIVGDLSLGKSRDYKKLLFEKISSFVENKFDLENKLVWKKFKNQTLILDKLYSDFIISRDNYFYNNPTKVKIDLSLILICIEKVLRSYNRNHISETSNQNKSEFEANIHIRDTLKGYAAEILKYFMFKDISSKKTNKIYCIKDVEIICKHFEFYDEYESIKDIMEYFRFSQLEIKKDSHLSIDVIGEEFNRSVLISNFREKGARYNRYSRLISNYRKSNIEKKMDHDINDYYSMIELERILGEEWKSYEIDGISVDYWNRAYLFVRKISNKKLNKENDINQLDKLCIVKSRTQWALELKKFLKVSKEIAEKILDNLIFSKESYDLIDAPFIQLGDYLAIIPSISQDTISAFAIISNFSKRLNKLNDLSKKGYFLEKAITSVLNDGNMRAISNLKDSYLGENYEIDQIFAIGDIVYLVECKTLPYPYTVKEHAEQLCMIYGYLKKFERNIDYFIRNSQLFISKLGIERVRDFKKIFITSTMLGAPDSYNDIYIVDESSFSAFLRRYPPVIWDFCSGRNIFTKDISYYTGEITNSKMYQFLKQPAPIDAMKEKIKKVTINYRSFTISQYSLENQSEFISVEDLDLINRDSNFPWINLVD
jgi:hypothetical protein